MAEENTCVVCLESLFNENCSNLGICNPCGHPCHVSCFRGWESSKVDYYGDRSRVTCPFCNSHSASFTKIYLCAPTVDYGMDDDDDSDDDSSVSSMVESVAGGTDGDEEEAENGNADNDDSNNNNQGATTIETNDGLENAQLDSPYSQSTNDKEEKDDTSDVVDLTASSPEKPLKSKKKKKSNASSMGEQAGGNEAKLKQKMKYYKKQYKQSQSRLQECSQQQRQLLEKHNEMKQKVKEAEQSSQESQSYHQQNLLELQEVRRQNVALTREVTKATSDHKKAEEKLKEMTTQFSRAEKLYKDKLEQIRKSNNIEIQKMLDEFPKLSEENKRLKETLCRKNEHWSKMRVYLKQLDPDMRERIERSVGGEPFEKQGSKAAAMNTRQLREGLKMAQDMAEGFNKRKRDQSERPSTANSKIASNPKVAHVARATEQARAPKKPRASSGNVDALLSKPDYRKKTATTTVAPAKRRVSTESTGGGSSAQLQQSRQTSTTQRPLAPSINFSAKSKRKPLATNRKIFSKSAKGNGDIRTWL